jgi:hypothetical protein
MKLSIGSVDAFQNILGKLLLIVNGPVKTILTLHEAEMELRVVLWASLRYAVTVFRFSKYLMKQYEPHRVCM